MPAQTPTVNVLTLDPVSRKSSRRIAAEAQPVEGLASRYETAFLAELKRDAKALGVTPTFLETHDDIYCACDEILRIEAAYRRSTQAGRLALVAEINATFVRGYDAGLDDARVKRASGG